MIMNAIVSIARLMQARGCKRNFSQFSIVPHSSPTYRDRHQRLSPSGNPTWHGKFQFFPARWAGQILCGFTDIFFRRAPDVAHGQVPNQDMVRLHQGCRRDPRPSYWDQRQLPMTVAGTKASNHKLAMFSRCFWKNGWQKKTTNCI